jgi:hypothetical protein
MIALDTVVVAPLSYYLWYGCLWCGVRGGMDMESILISLFLPFHFFHCTSQPTQSE